jgi:carbon-monoxide dehydrogenase large subunit
MTSTTTPAPAGTRTTAARFIGQSITRKEDKRLVTGHGQYVDDVVLPAMLHGAFLRSEVARATVSRVDTSAAEALPGVVAVFTWQDFDGSFGEAWHAMLSEAMVVPAPLAIGDVRYVGDLVAFVVAESRYVAEDACELIEVDYDLQPAVADYRTAKDDTDNVVHAAWGLASNAMADVPFMPLSGDLDDTFERAPHVIECTVEQNRYLALPMETRGILASWNPGREEMAIVCATQSVHETRNFFARYLNVPEANVRVTARDVGGGFGQ